VPNGEPNERIFHHVDPSRREFVKRVLAGAAFAAPVVASFSIETLCVSPAYAAGSSASASSSSSSSSSASPSPGPCLADPGYVGPGLFQAYVEDVTGNTRVNGELVLAIRQDNQGESADITVRMTKDAEVTSAYLVVNSVKVATIALNDHDDFGHHDLSGKITAANLNGLCDFDSLLQSMASLQVSAMIGGTYSSESFCALGALSPASASPIIQING